MISLDAAARRPLSFSDLSEVMPDVRRSMSGHRTVGHWSLGQVCRHLADSFDASIDGFGTRRHWIKRTLMGKRMLHYVFTKGIPTDYTVTNRLTPPPGIDLDQTATALSRAIERYRSHQGRLHFHPLFGTLSRADWDRLQCIHCAHHLSFVIPDEEHAGQ